MNRLFDHRKHLVLDGAMGTQLIARGLQLGHPSILWNVERPDAVLDVQQKYADAGANCLTTNTFSGSPIMLDRSGISDRFEEVNKAAVAIAKQASAGRCKLLGDIGPSGEFLEPLGDMTEEQLADSVRKQAALLFAEGVDAFIVETMADPNEMRIAIQTVKEFGLPVIATYTFEQTAVGIRTMMGNSPSEACMVAIEAGADAVGANCGSSLNLHDYLKIANEIVERAGDIPVLLQPNAGAPTERDGVYVYDVSTHAYGEWAALAVREGVRLIGGCCGTSPEHIHAVAQAIQP
jgi:5-methyltetrahydrofolate--homocysteine methyltransferase